jgi:glutamate dehydrogenase
LLIPANEHKIAPQELIKYILKAKVDLFWNGGIGTFVKASNEDNLAASDSFNDAIRINGCELGAKVVGEGGNLGMTQLGRIEYDLSGGKINTDAIDNSAGVDCSDHEVNIKIALNQAVLQKKMTVEERNKLLQDMTSDVCNLVLKDNYLQTRAISASKVGDQNELLIRVNEVMRYLELAGMLDRKLENLPDEGEIARRKSLDLSFSRPELAVILSYSKIKLYSQLIKAGVAHIEHTESYLVKYFPKKMMEKYSNYVLKHPLRTEIITTALTNEIINRLGLTLPFDVVNTTAVGYADFVKAYLITKDVFDLENLWKQIDALDGQVPPSVQYKLGHIVSQFTARAIYRIITLYRRKINIDTIKKDLTVAQSLLSDVGLMRKNYGAYIDDFIAKNIAKGVPQKLTLQIASMSRLRSVISISEIIKTYSLPQDLVVSVFSSIDKIFDLQSLKESSFSKIHNYWEIVSCISSISAIVSYESEMCVLICKKMMKKKINVVDVEATTVEIKEILGAKLTECAALCMVIRRSDAPLSAVLSLTMQRLGLLVELI